MFVEVMLWYNILVAKKSVTPVKCEMS